MLNPGVKTLANLAVTTALSSSAQTAITDLDGMSEVTIEAVFQGGSGGTSCSAVVQTTFDGGATWRDIARFDFTNAAATKHATLRKGSKAVTTYVALSSEGVNDGILGDRLRAVVNSVGTYTNTNLAVRAGVG